MPITEEQLLTKITGTINGLARMTPKERQAAPTIAFAEDYNKSREFALQLRSDLADLLPPAVEIVRNQMQQGVRGTYGEIITYCQQIVSLLNGASPPSDY